MIRETEQKHLDQLQYERDIDKICEIAKASDNPSFLQQYAMSYNWDDGYTLPKIIATNEHCDLGTAVTLFWLAGGMSYFLKEIERNEYNDVWADFCEMLVQKLNNNDYACGPVSFTPNINKLTQYKYQKTGIPFMFYQAVYRTSI